MRCMHPRLAVSDGLAQLAAAQSGVVSTAQLEAHGFTRNAAAGRVNRGYWSRLARGIYFLSPLAPQWSALAWAGLLLGGAEATLGGSTAAYLWGFARAEQMPIQILVSASARAPVDTPWWVFHRTRISLRPRGTPPRTSVERTVLDLCAEEPQRIVHWVTEAVGSRLTTPDRLREELATRKRHPVRQQLRELLGDVRRGAHSPLEVCYLRDVERAHGIAAGRRQVRGSGYVRDVDYPEGLIVELDGQLGHTGVAAFRDMDRDNYHLVRGRPTLRFGWEQCRSEPCRVAALVVAVRRSLGWGGTMTRCARCRHIPDQDLFR